MTLSLSLHESLKCREGLWRVVRHILGPRRLERVCRLSAGPDPDPGESADLPPSPFHKTHYYETLRHVPTDQWALGSWLHQQLLRWISREWLYSNSLIPSLIVRANERRVFNVEIHSNYNEQRGIDFSMKYEQYIFHQTRGFVLSPTLFFQLI